MMRAFRAALVEFVLSASAIAAGLIVGGLVLFAIARGMGA